MAKISMLERDLTTAGNSNVTANVVYVPGYAIMGPVNQPVLCNTLAEFKKTFGPVPYTFKNVQALGEGSSEYKFATAGDYEQSYMYAAELVRAGLPVLFERVGTVDTKATKTFDLNVVSYKSQPICIEDISDLAISIKDTDIVEETIETDVTDDESGEVTTVTEKTGKFIHTFTVDRLIKADSLITIKASESSDTLIEAELVVDEDGLQSIKFKADEKLNDFLVSFELDAPICYYVKYAYEANSDNKYAMTPSVYVCTVKHLNHTGDLSHSDASWSKINLPVSVDIVNYNNATFVDEFGAEHTVQLIPTLDTTVKNDNQLVINAKYPGKYGANIQVKITEKEVDSDIYYDIYVNQVAGSIETYETRTISLDETNDKYYKDVEFDLVDFEGTKIDFNIARNNLIRLDDIVNGKLINLDYYEDSNADEFEIKKFYDKLTGSVTDESILEKLVDKDEYQIKFITTGSYPVFGLSADYNSIVIKMLKVAADRSDCVALIDHKDGSVKLDGREQSVEDMFESLKSSLKTKILGNKEQEDAKKYGAMFTPWGKYNLNVIKGIASFPGSYGYLRCVASSFKTNAAWLAVAGATRGQVPDLLSLNSRMTGAIADLLQSRTGISVNPITNVKPYGLCIWGNRTLFNNIEDLTASSFLNIRMLTSDVKKVVYAAAKKMTFELNSDVLWLNFKAAIEPTLDQMVSGNGLTKYKIIKLNTTKKATIACTVRLWAVEAVEDWDINIELADGYTSIN